MKCLFNENKGPFNTNTPNSIKKELSRESAIVCSLNHPNPRSEKNKRDIAMSAGRTHDNDTKRSEKKGAEACEERERARKRGGRLRLTSVPFLSMSSSHEREERSARISPPPVVLKYHMK